MLASIDAVAVWIGEGLREAASMLWLTWWPLVLGFTLSGIVQSAVARDGLRRRLGRTDPASVATSSMLGVISSSCSYAASAMGRALFARGASWTNAVIFMVASTNLVIELGIVLYLLLGWQFVVAQFVGGAIMIAVLSLTTHLVFSRKYQRALRDRVLADSPVSTRPLTGSWRERMSSRETYARAARYTIGDLTMLRKELAAGFLIAGFISVHVPASWWANIFFSGHGTWTVLENVVLAPLLAVFTFVCSVGNIPLAGALWANGVAFGGVISFIFADLITLPLLLIYRRFYGTGAALRLFGWLWAVMSLAGLVVNGLFSAAGLVPVSRDVTLTSGHFVLGWTLVLNVIATGVLVSWWILSRTSADERSAIDPICAMAVDTSEPVATRQRDGQTFFFCSLRCAERFDRGEEPPVMTEDPAGDRVDPICAMTVDSRHAVSALGADGVTYYFCGDGCRRSFLGSNEPPTQGIKLGPKPSHE